MQNQNSSIADKNICCQVVFVVVVVEQYRAKLPAREYNRTTILKNEIEKLKKNEGKIAIPDRGTNFANQIHCFSLFLPHASTVGPTNNQDVYFTKLNF